MTLKLKQKKILKDIIEGAKEALTLHHEMMDYEHDHIETEYIITTKIAENLVKNNEEPVRVEYPTKKLRSVLLKDKRYGKKAGKIPEPKIRSGRIDVVMFKDLNIIRPILICEAKIKVKSFKSIEKDAVRFANIFRLLDEKYTSELLGICVFPLVESGKDIEKMNKKLEDRINKIKKDISKFNKLYTWIEANFYNCPITTIYPKEELMEEGYPSSVYLTTGYLTHLAGVTIVCKKASPQL